ENDTVYLPFTWYAKAGTHILRIEIDPENKYPELREDNNIFTQKLEVSFIELWNAYLYIVIATVAAITVTLGWKKLKKKGKKR
ncbi:MAG: hypothetical protein AB1485_06980, partial [Candidatus Thermoplasmatota archaeon]